MKKLFAGLLVIVLTLSLTGNRNEALAKKKILVGMSIISMSDTFIKMLVDGISEQFKADGVELVTAECGLNPETQYSQIENFAAMGCQEILALPINVKALESLVKKLRARGIKIVLIGSIPSTYTVDATINCDSVKIGDAIGKMALKWVDNTFPNAAPGSVHVAFLGEYNDEENIKRSDAMMKVIKDDPRTKVVFEKLGAGVDNVKALDATNEALAIDRNIRIFLCYSEVAGIAVNNVVMGERSIDKKKFAAFAGGYSPASMKLVEKSKKNKSILRGLIKYGSDNLPKDVYETARKVLFNEVEIPYRYYDPTTTVNTVGYVID